MFLSCYLRGDEYNDIFEVEIGEEKSVYFLKSLIKEKNNQTFGNIDARSLVLWNVSIPYDHHLKDNVKMLNLVIDKSLPSMAVLSDVFSNGVDKGAVHIVVEHPHSVMQSQKFILNCYVHGDNPHCVFEVDVTADTSVAALKEAIKEKKRPIFDHVPADSLVLWKALLPINDMSKERLGQISVDGYSLKPLVKVSNIFDKKPGDDLLHIVISPASSEPSIMLPNGRPLRQSDTSPSKAEDRLINQFLDKCRLRMQTLVANADNIPSFLPSWEPKTDLDEHFMKHMHKLRIPAVSSGQLGLLLHDLGEERNELDRRRAARIPEIFSFAKHTVLINTSGSGKTRLLLEGLCRLWGFYFVAQPDSAGIGSGDLYHIVNNLDAYQDDGRSTVMNKGSSTSPSPSVQQTRETVRRGLAQLLLARFLLLSLLVEEAKKAPQPLPWNAYRRLWVLLQVQPNVIFGTDFRGDVFTELALLLQSIGRSSLEEQIHVKYQELSFLLTVVNNPATNKNQQPPFFCVLDEAQVTTCLHYRNFSSDDFSSKCSILREIWLSWTSVLNPQQMRLMISGTGVELQPVVETLASAVLKPEAYQLQHHIGAFEDPEHQAAYIKQYIQVDWTEERWKEFLSRAWTWFRGRYRSTATLISLILQAGYQSPHKIINTYVETFTDFRPTDADNLIMHEPDLSFNIKSEVTKLNFDKMDDMQSRALSEVLFDQCLHGSYSLGSFTPHERAMFVQYGFARHKAGTKNTVLDEPLMILAALDWVNKQSHLSHTECLNNIEKHSKRQNNGFEAYFALYIRNVFETPKKLDEVFTFQADSVKGPDLFWQYERFELVTVIADGKQPRISAVKPSCGPSSSVGFLAESGEEVLEWLSINKNRYALCFPLESFGPDILFFLRSVASGKLLLVLAQCKKYNSIEKCDSITGVRIISPSWLWKSKNLKHQTTASASLINSCDLLCILASWAGDMDLDQTLPPSQTMTDETEESTYVNGAKLHPGATLHLDNSNGVSKQLDINWFRGDAEQMEVVHLKRSASSVVTSISCRQKRTKH